MPATGFSERKQAGRCIRWPLSHKQPLAVVTRTSIGPFKGPAAPDAANLLPIDPAFWPNSIATAVHERRGAALRCP